VQITPVSNFSAFPKCEGAVCEDIFKTGEFNLAMAEVLAMLGLMPYVPVQSEESGGEKADGFTYEGACTAGEVPLLIDVPQPGVGTGTVRAPALISGTWSAPEAVQPQEDMAAGDGLGQDAQSNTGGAKVQDFSLAGSSVQVRPAAAGLDTVPAGVKGTEELSPAAVRGTILAQTKSAAGEGDNLILEAGAEEPPAGGDGIKVVAKASAEAGFSAGQGGRIPAEGQAYSSHLKPAAAQLPLSGRSAVAENQAYPEFIQPLEDIAARGGLGQDAQSNTGGAKVQDFSLTGSSVQVRPAVAGLEETVIPMLVKAVNGSVSGESEKVPEGAKVRQFFAAREETMVTGEKAGLVAQENGAVKSNGIDGVEAVKPSERAGYNHTGDSSLQSGLIQHNMMLTGAGLTEDAKVVALSDLKDKVAQEIKRALSAGKSDAKTEFQLKLEPEHLGRITVKLFLSNGELNVHFYTGNHTVKGVLESSLPQLRDSLIQQDLRLNEAFVFVGSGNRGSTGHGFEERNGEAVTFYGRYNNRGADDIRVEHLKTVAGESAYSRVDYLV